MTVWVKLSSKGQLVIPQAIRRSLKLAPGTKLQLEIVEDKIVLGPLAAASPIDALYGRFAGHDLIGDLEAEHRQEIDNEQAVRP